MKDPYPDKKISKELKQAIAIESQAFEDSYLWVESHMPDSFLQETDANTRMLIARNLLSFSMQDRYIQIHRKQFAIVLCMDGPSADLEILKHHTRSSIRYYRAFVSKEPPPGQIEGNLRIALIYFREPSQKEGLSQKQKDKLLAFAKTRNPKLDPSECELLLRGFTSRFLQSMTEERLEIALDLFFRARGQDCCQFEIRCNEDWATNDGPSLQLLMAWRNVPKAGFLYKLAKIMYAHGLAVQKMIATYVDPYSTENILVLSLGLHGLKGNAAWKECDLEDFLREVALTKFFEIEDLVGTTFVQTRLLTGNQSHLVRNFISFTHQILVYADPNLYSLEHIIDGFCRHPELTLLLCLAFEKKFHPKHADVNEYKKIQKKFIDLVEQLDTGQAVNDLRRKNILRQGSHFIEYTLKSNFYQNNKTSFSFRLHPEFLNELPYNRTELFPDLPFGIFFIRGMHFIGFNIRFKDLARGGMRTVIPEKREQFANERIHLFAECYNLAYTQQKKNKDIPEGGAKTVILLKPYDLFSLEEQVYRKEMEEDGMSSSIIEHKVALYRKAQKDAYRNASQRCFIESLMSLIHCKEDGSLFDDTLIDYWKQPEYIYLGPDENIFNDMINWIANYAVECGYKPGRSFMSSKPGGGINHKEFGVTSYGIHVYLHETLLRLGIDPLKDRFTIKISGGPDGDVAGNEILNLFKFYPQTAKLVAITDVSGTISDPQGLDLSEMVRLFHESLPVRNYPVEKLSEGGLLLDLQSKKEETAYAQQTLLYRKKEGKVVKEWLSGNEMNHLYRNHLHQTKADVFIPAGGRPRTLNESNYQTFLDANGIPTSKAIVEGANLYLTPGARRALEKLGVFVLKDSSCNKGGVICSSFEVLSSLCISESAFLKEKSEYVKQILEIIHQAARSEALLLFHTQHKTGAFLTDISDTISEKINLYKYQLLAYFESINLPRDPKHPLIRCLIAYCPPLLRQKYQDAILQIPEIHQKAIIACYLASRLVYHRGVDWIPSIVDILPLIVEDPNIIKT